MFQRFYPVLLLAWLTVFFFTAALGAPEKSNKITILFPDVSEVHGHLFQGLIEGIQSVPGYEFNVFRVDEATTRNDILAHIHEKNIAGIIALGQTSYKLAESLNSTLPVVAGGMVVTPPGVSGISLTADPEAFFRNLQILSPGIVRVHLVYTDTSLGWLMDRITGTSEKYGIKVQSYRAENAREAIGLYKTVYETIQGDREAVWLPLDNVVPYNILLPGLLQMAWEKNVTVFSNNIQHARQGVLFALYPDHYKQGRRLVSILAQHLDNQSAGDILLTSVDVKVAVNIRTAGHLNQKYSRPILEKIDQIYPAYND